MGYCVFIGFMLCLDNAVHVLGVDFITSLHHTHQRCHDVSPYDSPYVSMSVSQYVSRYVCRYVSMSVGMYVGMSVSHYVSR